MPNDDPQPHVVAALGVANHEPGPLKTLAVIDLGAFQILETQGIDDQRHIIALDGDIAVIDLAVKREPILEAGAPAAGDVDPQLQVGIGLFQDQFPHFLRLQRW